VPGVVPVPGFGRRRSAGSDSRAGFAARAGTAGVCGCLCGARDVALDPVARRRPAPWAGPPGAVPGGAGRSAAAHAAEC
jgi:hypothetical protein